MVSKTLRIAIIFTLVITTLNNFVAVPSIHQKIYYWNPLYFDHFDFIFSIILYVMATVLQCIYYRKMKFWFPFIALILLNISNITVVSIDHYFVSFSTSYPTIQALIFTVLILISITYGLSFLISKNANPFLWLKIHGIAFLVPLFLYIIAGFMQRLEYYEYITAFSCFSTIPLIVHYIGNDHIPIIEQKDIIDTPI